MKYDIFILYARADADFAKAAAKGLEKYNLSVLYQESLSDVKSLSDEIDQGFSRSLFGIIIISKNLMDMKFSHKDLEYLYAYATLEDQVLHPVWYKLTERHVVDWWPKLAECLAVCSPPETPDSIARKFQMKLAGSPNLQTNVLSGVHPQIQYIPPNISTFRGPSGVPIQTEGKDSVTLNNVNPNINEETVSLLPDNRGQEKPVMAKTEAPHKTSRDINDEPIRNWFSPTAREQICKRLDVYLKGLSNWKNLAFEFKIKDKKELDKLLASGAPTMQLLEILAIRDVKITEFKKACHTIDRDDVVEYIDSYMSKIEIPL